VKSVSEIKSRTIHQKFRKAVNGKVSERYFEESRNLSVPFITMSLSLMSLLEKLFQLTAGSTFNISVWSHGQIFFIISDAPGAGREGRDRIHNTLVSSVSNEWVL